MSTSFALPFPEEKRRGGEGGKTESDFSTYAAIT
jgi:hypothetical protein